MLKHQHKNDQLLKEEKKLSKEWDVLRRKGLEYIKLDKPYRRGWKRFYVWHDFVKDEKRYSFFEKILPYINTTVYCKSKDFKQGRKKKEMYQTLKPIDVKDYNALYGQATEPEKRYFNYYFKYMTSTVYEGSYIGNGYKRTGYYFKFPNWVKLKIRPNIVTHVLNVEGDVYKRRQEINRWYDEHIHRRGSNPRRWRGWEEHINVRRHTQESIDDILADINS